MTKRILMMYLLLFLANGIVFGVAGHTLYMQHVLGCRCQYSKETR